MHHTHSNTGNTRESFTTAPIALPAGVTVPMKPEFIRLPRPGTLCPWTGLSRSKMWEVLLTGKVQTVCLRKPGAAKGARLVHLESLLAYLHSLMETLPPVASRAMVDDE